LYTGVQEKAFTRSPKKYELEHIYSPLYEGVRVVSDKTAEVLRQKLLWLAAILFDAVNNLSRSNMDDSD
jgi:hypothetical protein